ncbi:hypothetical protein AB7M16_004347 [Bradyrhizobium sp. USDA 372]
MLMMQSLAAGYLPPSPGGGGSIAPAMRSIVRSERGGVSHGGGLSVVRSNSSREVREQALSVSLRMDLHPTPVCILLRCMQTDPPPPGEGEESALIAWT